MTKTYELTYKGKIQVAANNLNEALAEGKTCFSKRNVLNELRIVSVMELIEDE